MKVKEFVLKLIVLTLGSVAIGSVLANTLGFKIPLLQGLLVGTDILIYYICNIIWIVIMPKTKSKLIKILPTLLTTIVLWIGIIIFITNGFQINLMLWMHVIIFILVAFVVWRTIADAKKIKDE